MIKKEEGITLISLIITIMIMLIIGSTVGTVSLERFKINNFKKMANDIELLQDKVSNYYLKYSGLPVLRNESVAKIYPVENLEFTRNSRDNNNYYIIDLEAMEGISLNYGADGFKKAKNGKATDDIYIINQLTHTIYYVRGMELDGAKYHYIDSGGGLEDNIPPSSPQINIISGTKNASEVYTTNVEIEIIHGKDNLSGIEKTEYSLDGGTTWKEHVVDSNSIVLQITTNGTHTIKAKSYDKAGTTSSETSLIIKISK